MIFNVPTFDALLNAILTDYVNQEFHDQDGNLIQVDTSKGSLVYIKSAAIASALWGIYQHQRWIADQIYPDTASSENLEHHAWLRGITRKSGETDAELLTQLLEAIRHPPAGGNKYDYVRWAMEVTDVAAAYCYPLAQGDGTVDVVILANKATTGSEVPTNDLRTLVLNHINDVRPVTHSQVQVLAPTIDATNVTMTVTGTGLNLVAIANEVTALLNSMAPNQTLYRAQINAIAIQAGAVNCVITAPAADVVPAANHMVRAGVINVT